MSKQFLRKGLAMALMAFLFLQAVFITPAGANTRQVEPIKSLRPAIPTTTIIPSSSPQPIGDTVPVPSKAAGSKKTPSDYQNGIVFNEYIAYRVNDFDSVEYGKFTIGTTGGDPDTVSDDYAVLLFGHPNPWSSYTTIRLDDQNYVFNPNTQLPTVDEPALSNTSEMTINNVSYKQVITIKDNTSTGRKDTVEIKYIVKNNDTLPHSSGLRIMMDTMLGDNDGAPFRVPGIGAVTMETELTGSNIPQYWQAFDNLENPSVIAQGTFFSSPNNKPDKVQFTNWGQVYNQPWDYVVNPSWNNGDSAVSIYWNPVTLAPGETKEYVTYYGLSEISQAPPTVGLSLSLAGPAVISIDNSGYTPNPFTITSYVENTGNTDAVNSRISLSALPDGVVLAAGQTQEVQLGTILPGEVKQASWQVEVLPRSVDRNNVSYEVTAVADNVASQTVSRNLTIPAYNPLMNISLDSTAYNLAVGSTHNTVVTAHFYDGSTQNVSSSATYQSSNTAVATVNASGTVTAVSSGQAVITASYQGKTATATVTVPKSLVGISFSLSALKLNVGGTYTPVVQAKYSDGSTQTLTTGVTFQSTKTAIASVNASGIVTGVKAGKAAIIATHQGKTATMHVTVAEKPKLSSISVNTPTVQLKVNNTQNLIVTAKFADGSTQNMTSQAAYQSSPLSVATVNAAGQVKGIGAGTANITVTYGGKAAKVRVRVTN